MSEHAWVQENIAAYVAGGLEGAEAERIEQHTAECPACAALVRETRALDSGMVSLFASARPSAELEHRVIQSLRVASTLAVSGSGWGRKLLWGTAATVALGLTGA